MTRTPLALSALAIAAALAGCSDKMCPANPPSEPWKAHMDLIPSETVVCGNNRGPQDSYGPEQLFVYYKGKNSTEAFAATKERFEKAGWKPSSYQKNGEGSNSIFDAEYVKGSETIRVSVNKNDFGTQGSFVLKRAAP